ncbi:hypothetical protein M1328_01205 [Patescibacteria group bacterium]|nr:hypothetical protein [Patescibacteria group bacterium]
MSNHKHLLRELAKFFSGLVVGDFLVGLWVALMKVNSVVFLGIAFDRNMIMAWMFCDVVTFALLVHYGWRANIISPSVTQKSVFQLVGVVFAGVSFAHFLRIAYSLPIVIGNLTVPIWVSWIGLVVGAYLSYASFHFATATKGKR